MKVPIFKKYFEKESVFIERRLPSKGEIYVKIGDAVNSFDTIGIASVVKDRENLKVSGKIMVKLNQRVYPGDVISIEKKLFTKNKVTSSISGRVCCLDEKRGVVEIEGSSSSYKLIAGVKGEVVDILKNESVLIKTPAVVLKSVAGSGEEVAGELKYFKGEVVGEELIDESVIGKILVANKIEVGALYKAKTFGASGFVIASCEYSDFLKFIKDKINVLVLEGFGNINFIEPFKKYLESRDSIFAILRTYENFLVIPRESLQKVLGGSATFTNHFLQEIKVGDTVMVFTKQNYGEMAKVTKINSNSLSVLLIKNNVEVEVLAFSVGLIFN